MIMVKEARWRAHGLWIVLGMFVLPALVNPSWTAVTVAFLVAILVSWIQQRRQRASLIIDEYGIFIANKYSTHLIARRGASVRVINGGRNTTTGHRETKGGLPMGQALFIVPGEAEAGHVQVDAIQSLKHSEFRRVAEDIRATLRAA